MALLLPWLAALLLSCGRTAADSGTDTGCGSLAAELEPTVRYHQVLSSASVAVAPLSASVSSSVSSSVSVSAAGSVSVAAPASVALSNFALYAAAPAGSRGSFHLRQRSLRADLRRSELGADQHQLLRCRSRARLPMAPPRHRHRGSGTARYRDTQRGRDRETERGSERDTDRWLQPLAAQLL